MQALGSTQRSRHSLWECGSAPDSPSEEAGHSVAELTLRSILYH
jgi:hypothetical protein